jgi:hypothetical protein
MLGGEGTTLEPDRTRLRGGLLARPVWLVQERRSWASSAYLATYDLTNFDSKAPPPRTPAAPARSEKNSPDGGRGDGRKRWLEGR